MSELRGLWVYASSRFRRTTLFFAASTLLTVFALWAMQRVTGGPLVRPGEGGVAGYLAVGLLYSLLPAALWGIFVVDFHDNQHVDHAASGFSHYLMRMPIATWKLAVAALSMKAVWIGCVAIALVACLRIGIDSRINLLAPTLAMQCIGVWVSWFVWRPLAWKFTRIASLLLLIPMSYGVVAGSILLPRKLGDWPNIDGTVLIGLVGIYALSCWMAYRSLIVARTNAMGKANPSEDKQTGVRQGTQRNDLRHRVFASPEAAIGWHDRRRSSEVRSWASATVLLPAILAIPFLGGPLLPIVIVIFFVLIWATFLLSTGLGEGVSKSSLPTLPAYLVVAPISSARIAFARARSTGIMTSIAVMLGLIGFAILFAQPTRQAQWSAWASQVALLPTVDSAAFAAGLRYSVAIGITMIVTLYAMPQRFLWITMSGRQWIAVAYGGVLLLAVIVCGGLLFQWFMAQSDYDHVWKTIGHATAWAPALIATVLVTKIIAAVAVAVRLQRSDLVARWTTPKMVTGWIGLVLCFSLVVYFAVPDARFTLASALGMFGLIVPLPSVLAMPIAVSENRHRT